MTVGAVVRIEMETKRQQPDNTIISIRRNSLARSRTKVVAIVMDAETDNRQSRQTTISRLRMEFFHFHFKHTKRVEVLSCFVLFTRVEQRLCDRIVLD